MFVAPASGATATSVSQRNAVRRLPPWHGNVGKRLVRTPKVYVRDSGLAHALLGLTTLDQFPVLAREPASRFTLIYGNRQLQSTMFKEEIEDLKNRYLTRLVLHHVFSAEQTDAPLNMGLMNRDKLGEFLASVVPAAGIAHAYICGPFQMNDEAEAALLAAGVPENRVHIERFGVAPQAGQAVGAVVHEALPGDAEDARIVILRDGPTVGGYPKIGVIDPDDVNWLVQTAPGQKVHFTPAEPAGRS